MKTPIIFVTGPTFEDDWIKQILEADNMLSGKGFAVIYRTDNDYKDLPARNRFQLTFAALSQADALFLLPGWEYSDECNLLEGIAEAMDLPVFDSVYKLCEAIPRPI